MYIQAWDIRDGSPYLFFNDSDITKNITKNITMIKPPDGIYQPFYFDIENQEWVGSEPFHNENGDGQEEDNNGGEEMQDKMEEQIAHLMFENSQLQSSIQETEEEMAGMLFSIAEIVEKSNKEENSGEDVIDDTEIPNI